MADSSPSDVRTWQVLAHLSGLIWVVGVPGVVGPLVVWLLHRENPEIEPHAREALNFHISTLVYGAGAVVLLVLLAVSLVGILLIPVLVIAGIALLVLVLVVTILGGVSASRGELYRYPLNLRLIH